MLALEQDQFFQISLRQEGKEWPNKMERELWQPWARFCYLPKPSGRDLVPAAGPYHPWELLPVARLWTLPAPGAAPCGQAVTARRGALLLQAVELCQAEASGQSVHHPSQGEKGRDHLEGKEGGEDDVHGSLQRVDFQTFIK